MSAAEDTPPGGRAGRRRHRPVLPPQRRRRRSGRLAPFEPPWSDDTPAVVLASMANPAEGLCAVYLATVGQTNRGKITAWGETVEVWRRGDEAAPAEVAPAETVAAPVLRRGPKKAKTNGRR